MMSHDKFTSSISSLACADAVERREFARLGGMSGRDVISALLPGNKTDEFNIINFQIVKSVTSGLLITCWYQWKERCLMI